MRRNMFRIEIFSFIVLSTLLMVNAADKAQQHPSNQTESVREMDTNRKERLDPLNTLKFFLGGSGSQSTAGSSGTSGSSNPVSSIQQGLKGIQAIQKFMNRFQGVMKVPFSFRGVTDTMASLTGLLAAVGGGYLTYVSMVALFGSMLDPHNTAYQHAYSSPPHQYAPPQHLNINGAHVQGYNRRQSSAEGSNFYFGSHDIGKMFQSVTNFNYPEASFKLLRIKDEACKQRAVCEFEKFLAKKGVASVILKGVSKKITGMEKYLDAAYRGLANEDCSYAFSSCPYTLGQTLLKSVGLS